MKITKTDKARALAAIHWLTDPTRLRELDIPVEAAVALAWEMELARNRWSRALNEVDADTAPGRKGQHRE